MEKLILVSYDKYQRMLTHGQSNVHPPPGKRDTSPAKDKHITTEKKRKQATAGEVEAQKSNNTNSNRKKIKIKSTKPVNATIDWISF